MTDERRRKVLGKRPESDEAFDDRGQNFRENDFERKNINQNDEFDDFDRGPKRGFDWLKLLYAFNLIAVIAIIGYAFVKNILPLDKRLIFSGGLLITEFLFYRMLVKSKSISFRRFLAILLFLITSLAIALMYYFVKIDLTIKSINEKSLVQDGKQLKTIDGKTIQPGELETGDTFNVYISGIDTYGDLSQVSRSDVNIIASVNLKTGKVLLTSVPRDTYLKIAGGGKNKYDKLTHAGIYGVNSSIRTLEKFLDIDVSYYARVNFTSMQKIIDAIGGVDVYNEEDFTFRLTGEKFPKGDLHLNGEDALKFVRERYSLADGDNARGRNQEKVVSAMIKKMTSPTTLLNFDKILEVLNESVNTNMSTETMMDLVNVQIFSHTDFDIQTQEVEGEGKMGLPSFAMPDNRLYMMVPFDESVDKVKENIQDILEK